jgi:hypothetical protein
MLISSAVCSTRFELIYCVDNIINDTNTNNAFNNISIEKKIKDLFLENVRMFHYGAP